VPVQPVVIKEEPVPKEKKPVPDSKKEFVTFSGKGHRLGD